MYSSVHRASLSEATELQRGARDPQIAGSWKLPDARTHSGFQGFEFGEPLIAEFPSRDTTL